MSLDYAYDPHPLDLDYERITHHVCQHCELYECDCRPCSMPDCTRAMVPGFDYCATHCAELAEASGDADEVAYWTPCTEVAA